MGVNLIPTAFGNEPTLADVIHYLSVTGWTTQSVDGFTVYYPAGDSDLQIVLPNVQPTDSRDPGPEAADSSGIHSRLDEAIRVIAYAETRTTREVRANLTGTGADSIAIRLLPATPTGTAPLAAAQEAITALRDLVVGAASALRNTSLVLPGRPPADIDDYASRTHFSTRPGSFIVDLTLPLTQETTTSGTDEGSQHPADAPEDEALIAVDDVDPTPQRDLTPYGRAVSRRIRQTITRALNTASQVTDGDLALTVFTQPALNLGNATELDAIANLGGNLGTPYQIRFAESALAPGAEPVEVLTATAAQQQVLTDAASLIRERQTFEDISLTGYIIRLVKKRPHPHAPGDVTIRTVVEELGDTINCWVHLAGTDYDQALTAHQDGHEVHVTGTLEYANNRWQLRAVTNFDVPAST